MNPQNSEVILAFEYGGKHANRVSQRFSRALAGAGNHAWAGAANERIAVALQRDGRRHRGRSLLPQCLCAGFSPDQRAIGRIGGFGEAHVYLI